MTGLQVIYTCLPIKICDLEMEYKFSCLYKFPFVSITYRKHLAQNYVLFSVPQFMKNFHLWYNSPQDFTGLSLQLQIHMACTVLESFYSFSLSNCSQHTKRKVRLNDLSSRAQGLPLIREIAQYFPEISPNHFYPSSISSLNSVPLKFQEILFFILKIF